MNFRYILAVVAGLAMLSGPALAQQKAAKPPTPEHIAIARAVIEFTGAIRAFDSVIPQLLVDARNMVLNSRPQLQADLDSVIPGIQAELLPRETDLLNEIALVYASKMTEGELKEIAAFYRSPAGQKLIKTTPDVLRESLGKTQEWGQRLSGEVMNKIREEMKKKGHDI